MSGSPVNCFSQYRILTSLDRPHCLYTAFTHYDGVSFGVRASNMIATMRDKDSGFQGQVITSPEMVRPEGSEFPEIRHQRPTIAGRTRHITRHKELTDVRGRLTTHRTCVFLRSAERETTFCDSKNRRHDPVSWPRQLSQVTHHSQPDAR